MTHNLCHWPVCFLFYSISEVWVAFFTNTPHRRGCGTGCKFVHNNAVLAGSDRTHLSDCLYSDWLTHRACLRLCNTNLIPALAAHDTDPARADITQFTFQLLLTRLFLFRLSKKQFLFTRSLLMQIQLHLLTMPSSRSISRCLMTMQGTIPAAALYAIPISLFERRVVC